MQIRIYFPWTSEQNLKDYIKPTHTKFIAKKIKITKILKRHHIGLEAMRSEWA